MKEIMMDVLPTLQKRDNWKKEPWLLLVIGGPLCVVCASLFTGYLAFSGADKVVTEDYYKQGLMINTDLVRDAKARALKLEANLHLQADGQLELRLQGQGQLPDTILLSVATSDAHDLVETTHRLPLRQVTPGIYQGKLSETKASLMHLKLEATGWRLTSDWHHPADSDLQIRAVN
ncbi:FixH family protein [Sapientia aquatica]|uniref:Nitrogen fixation protein FixH n=1 Tax=Sapientia aquatica TaxID=1549640 RepID=A0A4R5W869_9BURK|nr:FixH family protein [Sapientia aquatica]TDK68684.1 hypothetical protein E2I14_03880 [Sapientia aquatica]